MSKFFDISTGVLHRIETYAGAVKFANSGINGVKVKELNLDVIPAEPARLRRQNAGFFNKQVFSTEDKQVHFGNFDLKHHSNADLVKVTETLIYR